MENLTRQNSFGPESKDAEIQRLRAEREEQLNLLIKQQQEVGERSKRKLQAVDELVKRFNHTDVLKLMSKEPVKRFNPPRAVWRLCSHKTNIDDLAATFDTADWVKMHRVVRRAQQPWAKLILLELKSSGVKFPNNVVAILVQHFSGAELAMLVQVMTRIATYICILNSPVPDALLAVLSRLSRLPQNEKPYSLPAEIKEINQNQRALGCAAIAKPEWTIIHRVGAALGMDNTYSEGAEFDTLLHWNGTPETLCGAPRDILYTNNFVLI
jgi:hypothetical protein